RHPVPRSESFALLPSSISPAKGALGGVAKATPPQSALPAPIVSGTSTGARRGTAGVGQARVTSVVVVVEVEVVVVLVVVVVVGVAHPDAVQASQQLANMPTQALPFFGARHALGLDLIEHDVRPRDVVRQHVRAPARPHVDFAVQARTVLRHPDVNRPAATASAATADAQRVYSARLVAVAQGHVASILARTSATAARSSSDVHAARP